MSDFLLNAGRQTLLLELQEASRLPERLGEDFCSCSQHHYPLRGQSDRGGYR